MSGGIPTIEVSDPRLLAENPLVSVYMVTYRHARFVGEAIESVLAQTRDFPIELVIGEDCSPDDTREIAIDYQRRYPDIIRVLYSESNIGGKANGARCLAAMRGAYIAICEGDDYWCDPQKLMRQLEVMRRHPDCNLVFHAARIVDAETARPIGAIRWPFRSRRFSMEELVIGDGGLVPTGSILARRQVFDLRPAWALNAPVGDYPLALTAALSGDVFYLDRIMSVYRLNVPHSWTQRHTPSLAHRYRYACQIDAMLSGLQEQLPRRSRAIAATISKYYSDVLVRIDGEADERLALYEQIRSKLRGSDRWLAWLACQIGWRLPLVKDGIRKSKTFLRLLRAQFQRAP